MDLSKIVDKRFNVRCKVLEFTTDYNEHKKSEDDVIKLSDVSILGVIIKDFEWFWYGKTLSNVNPVIGDIISFDARLVSDSDGYHFSRYTKVKNLGKNKYTYKSYKELELDYFDMLYADDDLIDEIVKRKMLINLENNPYDMYNFDYTETWTHGRYKQVISSYEILKKIK